MPNHGLRPNCLRLIGMTLGAFVCTGAYAQGARAIPSVTGPIPGNTPTNHPFDGASYLTNPINLAASGYREDEYFTHGIANVYQLEDVNDPTDTKSRCCAAVLTRTGS